MSQSAHAHRTTSSNHAGSHHVARKRLADALVDGLAPSTLHLAHVARRTAGAGGATSAPGASEDDVARTGLAGGGGTLPYRAEMERSFGADFSRVRSYTGPAAASASKALGAEAYTLGDQVGFSTASPSRSLVAHELTHVVQQTGAHTARKASAPGESVGSEEGEASAVEVAVASGREASSALSGDGRSRAAVRRRTRKKALALLRQISSKFEFGKTWKTDGGKESTVEVPIVADEQVIPIVGPLSAKLACSLKAIIKKETEAPPPETKPKEGDVQKKKGDDDDAPEPETPPPETDKPKAGKYSFELKGSTEMGSALGWKEFNLYLTGEHSTTGAGQYVPGDPWSVDFSLKGQGTLKYGIKAAILNVAVGLPDLEIWKVAGVRYTGGKGFSGTPKLEWGADVVKAAALLAFMVAQPQMAPFIVPAHKALLALGIDPGKNFDKLVEKAKWLYGVTAGAVSKVTQFLGLSKGPETPEDAKNRQLAERRGMQYAPDKK